VSAFSNGVDLTAIPLFFFFIGSTTPWAVNAVASSVAVEVWYPKGQGRQRCSLEPGWTACRESAQQADGEDTLHHFLQHYHLAASRVGIDNYGTGSGENFYHDYVTASL
jgi:hypothetical protein